MQAIDRKVRQRAWGPLSSTLYKMENLDTILQHGVLSRERLNALGIPFEQNDDMRLDNCLNASCLSISFPNYGLFYKQRRQYDTVWVVIVLEPNILWEKDCLFCPDNAASTDVSSLSREDRRGIEAFRLLFNDFGDLERGQLPIPKPKGAESASRPSG